MMKTSHQESKKVWTQPELKIHGTVEELTKKDWGSQDTFFQTISAMVGVDIPVGDGS